METFQEIDGFYRASCWLPYERGMTWDADTSATHLDRVLKGWRDWAQAHGKIFFSGTSPQYDRDLFDGTTMERLAAQYEELLSAALAEPDLPIPELPALLPAERHQVFHEWNDTAATYASHL